MMNTDRESALYITPVMPQPYGNGLAMRAASMLQGLAERFDVHLFVVPVAGAGNAPGEFVRRYASRFAVLDLGRNLDPLFALITRLLDPDERTRALRSYPKPLLARYSTGDAAQFLVEWADEFPIAAIHVMRLYVAPLVYPFLHESAPRRRFCVLDLDDDEASTCGRLAALYTARGDRRAAAAAASEAHKYQSLAERYLPAFDRVIVCSQIDAARLGACFPSTRFAVVPNCYEPQSPVLRRLQSGGDSLRLLFVGTFGYFPNVDAAFFLCREILPALRRLTDRAIVIDLAGGGDTTALSELTQDPSITVHGFVDDLSSLYTLADIAVVPVRAGGGTRIKVLEAFAHGVPVVATRFGIEGIDAVHGEHLLLADEPEDFARACLNLKARPQYAAAIAARAEALLRTDYSPARLAAAIGGVYGQPHCS